MLGLAFLLLLAGLEVEFDMLRGSVLRFSALGFALSFGVAVAAGLILDTTVSSEESSGVGSKLVLLGGFALLVVAIGMTVARAGRSMRISSALVRLQDNTAQIRVRGAFVLLAGFVVLADQFGLEAILGAFIAGAVLKLVDTDRAMTHPQFHRKLEAAGFGVFVPFFFVTSGVRFNLDALFASGSTVARVPIFLAALRAGRGLPALLYRRTIGGRRSLAAGLLQATSLGFFVVAGQIGMELGLISEATGAAVVAAGLLSVLLFPVGALSLLRYSPSPSRSASQPA